MIQIQDVSFEYEKEQGTLSHIDLNIQQGECVVLTGESGCGKTTVTKLINGLIPHFVEGGTLSGKVMRLSDNSGEGMMTLYHVFPGVFLMYNDFHMKECISGFQTDMDLLCIDHCREGRIEQEVGQNAFSYLEAGDLRVDRRIHHSGKVEFPLCHYHGISIGFQVETAAKEIPASMKGFSVDLYELQK